MTAPTKAQIKRAMCCPSGRCASPSACYAMDKSRSYPVQMDEAADAVARLYAPTIPLDNMMAGADGR